MTTIHCDGFLFKQNPSPIGGGFTITDDEGNLIERETIHQPGLTNNEAELRGVVRAVQLSKKNGVVVTDSQIAQRWVRRGNCRTRFDLNSVARRGKRLVKRKNVTIEFVPRDENLAGIYNEKNRVDEPQSPDLGELRCT